MITYIITSGVYKMHILPGDCDGGAVGSIIEGVISPTHECDTQ